MVESGMKQPLKTADQHIVRLVADPGICGFQCMVEARKIDDGTVVVEISGSECGQIQHLAGEITPISLRELFTPLTRNPVYIAAEKSGCHTSCVIPAAVLKTVEAAMEMALPKDVRIVFKP